MIIVGSRSRIELPSATLRTGTNWLSLGELNLLRALKKLTDIEVCTLGMLLYR